MREKLSCAYYADIDHINYNIVYLNLNIFNLQHFWVSKACQVMVPLVLCFKTM